MVKELSGIKTGLKSVILLLSVLWLSSCGAPSRDDMAAGTPVSGTIGGASRLPAQISLSTTKVQVKSDNSDSATVTASVIDANNSPVEGTLVSFTATGGQISATTVTTDANGQASTTFSSGTVDKSNQTVTITASVLGLSPVQIPIQVIGSTVTLSTDNTTITTTGSTKATLTITVKDAGNIPVYNAPVTLSVSGTGTATLSKTSGNTDVQGQLSATITGTSAGSITVTVTALGVTATQAYTVTSPAAALTITSPTLDPASLSTSGSLTVTVSAPSSSTVVFASTLGVWDAGTLSVVEKSVTSGIASAVLTSTTTGLANIMVYDKSTPSLSDSLTVAISAPSSAAANISLQSNVNVLPPSLGSLKYTATLTATVRTAGNQVVGGAPVAFSIVNPTGGGETVSPVVVYTDSSGLATTTFTSGSLPSGSDGVKVSANVVGTSITVPQPVAIVIGGTAGSIVIGRSSEIKQNSTKTSYILPMSVLVADSNGNPVSGASITLSMWPVQYITDGTMDGVVGTFANEDNTFTDIRAENLILDAGEDLNGNGELTPPNSAAGTVPSTVITDASGVANFDLTYLKASSRWITARLRASALVQGTETRSSLVFILPPSKEDVTAGVLPPSPYTAPVVGVPFNISLAGAAGATVSQALTPTFGSGSYTFTADLGTMAPSSGPSSTYSYTIPGGITSGTVITDTITITDTSVPPAQVTINVTITVL